MTFLVAFALDQAKDLAFRPLLRQIRRIHTCEQDVMLWKQHKEIPIAGRVLRSKVRPASRFATYRNKQLVRSTRWFVETKTFEHVVALVMANVDKVLKKNLSKGLTKLNPKPTKPGAPKFISTKVDLI